MPTELFTVKNFLVALTHHATDMVDARVVVNAGASKEDADSWGAAHYLEHMFFKGTKKRSYFELNRLAAALGDINAHTGHDKTAYYLQFLPCDFAEAITLLMELVFEPAFPEDEFQKERSVIVEECQSRLDDPTGYFFDQTMWHLYGDQRCHPVIGTLDSIQAMTPDHLRRFIEKHYMPRNMLISIVGNLSREEVEPILEAYLPDMPDGEREPWWKDSMVTNDHAFHHASKQAIIALVAEGVNAQAEIDLGYLPDVFCNAFGGGMHSLLFDRLREKMGLCYATAAFHNSGANGGMLMSWAMLDVNNIGKATDEARKIMAEVKHQGFDEELLRTAKRNYLFRFAKRRMTPGGINSLLEAYFHLETTEPGSYISFEERQKVVNGITNDDMIAFANKIFGENKPLPLIQMTQDPKIAAPEGETPDLDMGVEFIEA